MFFITDINECTASSSCPAHSDCHDTIGSYTCTCQSGYKKQGDYCKGLWASVEIIKCYFVITTGESVIVIVEIIVEEMLNKCCYCIIATVNRRCYMYHCYCE